MIAGTYTLTGDERMKKKRNLNSNNAIYPKPMDEKKACAIVTFYSLFYPYLLQVGYGMKAVAGCYNKWKNSLAYLKSTASSV